LGSGFSKAVFPDNMPTVTELAAFLRQQESLKSEPYVRLADDPELLLSYLSTEQPWKEPWKALEDRAIFTRIQKSLAEHIATCEERAFKNPIPDWTTQLVERLHRDKTTVITFNYDTVLERLVHELKQKKTNGEWPREFDLYRLPLSVILLRESGTLAGTEIDTFHLIKLHGSVNWFYSGEEFPGEQVYYWPIGWDPLQWRGLNADASRRKSERLQKDKIPLIIPPVTEKSSFYGNRTVRTLWIDAQRALEEAEEIFCVGYSLPATDLTTKLFLRSVARPKKVIVVNKESGDAPEMLKRYREAFPDAEEIDTEIKGRTFMSDDSVKKMTEYLINSGRATDCPDRGDAT